MAQMAGMGESSTAQRYRTMAERELRGVSPSYERICLGVADDTELLQRLDALPVAKRQPNLLLAAVRFSGGPVGSWTEFRRFTLEHWSGVRTTMLARRTQTNEAARCATLLPALPPGPLSLLEVGASAGLCLQPDRYAYRYDGGPVLGGSPVVLDCDTSGGAPIPQRLPDVVWRAGLDLNPLDVRDEGDIGWLEALIWPEETERFARLRSAVQVARADPPPIVRGDLLTDLAGLAGTAPAESTLVIFHSAVLAYVDDTDRAAFAAAARELAARRAVCWLSNEAPGVVPGTDIGRGGPVSFVLARDGVPLARSAGHGQWLHWLA